MNNRFIIALLIAVIILVVAAIAVCKLYVSPMREEHKRHDSVEISNYSTADNKIYFLSTGSSDAIIIQSGEHFAMIDAGEDTDNPRGFAELELDGYEEKVLAFLKQVAGDENGRVHLDFVLGTHSHSDHIGGFDTVIYDKDITVDKAFLKVYNADCIIDKEVLNWDNQEVYDQMVTALESRGVPIVSDISDEPFELGDFTLTIMNTGYEDGSRKVGENDNSLAVLVQIGDTKILLSGDLDNKSGDEVAVARKTGSVDILKVGHHSYSFSTSSEFLKLTSPSLCIVTNDESKADKRTIRRIMRKTSAPVLYTGAENGICITFENDGYKISNDIH